MAKVLDLRSIEVSVDYSKRDINWIAAWILAVVFLSAGIAYMHWLDSGCVLQGAMTWHGKVCLQ